MDVFFKIFENLPRQGPGCSESTKRAFMSIPSQKESPLILDIGCGTGAQTVEIAKYTSGLIIALDFHLPFLKKLEEYAEKAGLSKKVKALCGSMDKMVFKKECFDIIWAEGSIYIIGFETGIKKCQEFIKPGGYLAVTEVSWLKDNPPEELHDFWKKEYPDIKTIDENLSLIRKNGYSIVSHFTLPEYAWWNDYYKPLEKQIIIFRRKYAGNKQVLDFLDEIEFEISIYRKYSDWYGYVFYLMQKEQVI